MKYTEKVHANRLIKMLEKPDPCGRCPGQKYYGPHTAFIKGAELDPTVDHPHHEYIGCQVCNEFLDMKPAEYGCPCDALGQEEALELTRKKLKEKGYL